MAQSSMFLAPPGGQTQQYWAAEDALDQGTTQYSTSTTQVDMSSIALAIVQQSYQVSTRRSTSPGSPLIMLEDQPQE